MAEILLGVSHAAYHGGELPGEPRLSRSIAWKLLTESPLRAWASHPKLGGGPPGGPSTKAADMGSLVHALLLGEGADLVEVRVHQDKARIGPLVEAFDYRTAEAQEVRDRAWREGKVPVLPFQLAAAREAMVGIREAMAGLDVHLEQYEKEVTLLWDEQAPDGEVVPCKARLDLCPRAGSSGNILDFKLPTRGTPASFQRQIPFNGTAMQAAVYKRALGLAVPHLAGRLDYEVLYLTINPPPDAAIIPVSPSQEGYGEQLWRLAVRTWAECRRTNTWPGYGRLRPIDCPPYLLEQALEASLAAAGEASWVTEEL